MQALAKGFSVFYFVLLPIFYAEKIIDSIQLGYIGALFIFLLIIGALIVARWLHGLETRKILQIASGIAIIASVILFFGSLGHSLPLLIISYSIMGLASGLATSGVNAFAAQITTRGDRYLSLAKSGMLTDIARVVFPVIASGAIFLGNISAVVIIISITTIIFLILSTRVTTQGAIDAVSEVKSGEKIRHNKNFLYVLMLEFVDSFSSSQLFVFLPLLFLAKGYSLESSLLFQSFIFLGYLSGRWLIGLLAKKVSGIKAVAYAELGMMLSILLLLFLNNLLLLYFLTFALGIFARGTSPAIKALAFDSLLEHQMKKGSALHVVAGDSGSAIGQLIFGFLVAWYGTHAPFLTSALIALLIAAICLIKPLDLDNH